MYDSSVGRWLEEDPLEFEAGDDNLYRYAGNHPTSATDPSGLSEFSLYQFL
jgi:RHS repeat-associated protein